MAVAASGVERRLRASDSVVSAELGEEAVLLNVESGTYFGLDEVGTRIWHLLAEGRDEAAIARALQDEYDVDAAMLRADVAAFLELLAAKGLARPAAE